MFGGERSRARKSMVPPSSAGVRRRRSAGTYGPGDYPVALLYQVPGGGILRQTDDGENGGDGGIHKDAAGRKGSPSSSSSSAAATVATAATAATAARVAWGSIGIREYARIAGDNPAVTSGPPISLGWDYAAEVRLSVEDYEAGHPPRRAYTEMVMPSNVRMWMLSEEWNTTAADMSEAVRAASVVRAARRRTVRTQGSLGDMVAYQLERLGRITGRMLKGRRRTREEYEDWKAGVIARWEREMGQAGEAAGKGIIEDHRTFIEGDPAPT